MQAVTFPRFHPARLDDDHRVFASLQLGSSQRAISTRKVSLWWSRGTVNNFATHPREHLWRRGGGEPAVAKHQVGRSSVAPTIQPALPTRRTVPPEDQRQARTNDRAEKRLRPG